MKRFIVMAGITLMLLTGCEGFKDGTPPTSSPTIVMPPGIPPFTAVPPGGPQPLPTEIPVNATTIPLRVTAHLLDPNGAGSFDEFEGEFLLEGHYPPREGRPVPNQAAFIDQDTGTPVPSPYRYPKLLPEDETHQMIDPLIFVSYTARATVPAGWRFYCIVAVNGLVVASHEVENKTGLPVEFIVLCAAGIPQGPPATL